MHVCVRRNARPNHLRQHIRIRSQVTKFARHFEVGLRSVGFFCTRLSRRRDSRLRIGHILSVIAVYQVGWI